MVDFDLESIAKNSDFKTLYHHWLLRPKLSTNCWLSDSWHSWMHMLLRLELSSLRGSHLHARWLHYLSHTHWVSQRGTTSLDQWSWDACLSW